MTNPYSPPESEIHISSGSRRIRWWPIIGAVVGGSLVSVAALLITSAIYCYVMYPDLQDHSPKVDAYWPALVIYSSGILAAIALVIGAPMLWVSVDELRYKRKTLGPTPVLP
jgi:hypothetical protein